MPPAERGLSGCWYGAIVIRVQLGSSSHHHIIEQHRSSSSASWPLSESNTGYRHRRSHVAIRVQHRSSFSETIVSVKCNHGFESCPKKTAKSSLPPKSLNILPLVWQLNSLTFTSMYKIFKVTPYIWLSKYFYIYFRRWWRCWNHGTSPNLSVIQLLVGGWDSPGGNLVSER